MDLETNNTSSPRSIRMLTAGSSSIELYKELCKVIEELEEYKAMVKESELEIKDLTLRALEAERVLRRCVAEMKYSAEIGQPISLDRVEFEMARKALGEE